MTEVKPFLLMLAIGNISFAILMTGYARTAARTSSVRVWIWAKAFQGLAQLTFLVRPELPEVIGVIASNGLFIIGVYAEAAAYCMLLGYRWQRPICVSALLSELMLVGAVFCAATPPQLAVLMSATLATVTGVMAGVLFCPRPGPGSAFLRRLIGTHNLLLCAALCWRGYIASRGTLTVYSPGMAQTMSYVANYLLLIVNSFGFLLLCKEKDDQEMHRLATTDSLTGLINRQAFLNQAASACMLAKRLRHPVSLMMIDIDHFKQVNDTFGHACGDEALRLFAECAQGQLRDHDIMGRLGGEEFAVLLPGTQIAGALQAAERLRLAIAAAEPSCGDSRYAITVSVGVVELENDELVGKALIRADAALYTAKSGGRNRVDAGISMPDARYG